ncbi:FMN-dependent NADH-azoreductase [Bacillus solimangrovi]|uniref:FMN dependent NADH:quinone oxidoreductase n=1 Tax=Bacillus solimangrovi TaxID=1305675 RepID=A0A1E5LEF1_9BACI|nr:FMN-dependent NADH-azoreductase [Bacillus solimangrovi]OEH92458.1 FMN-dependent NADH-azoreductase [Bacillus solimangrovi]
MSTVLVVKANPKETEHSFSLRLTESFLNEYKQVNPNDEVIELDLYKQGVPFIDADVLSAWGKFAAGGELTATELEKVGKIDALTEQFIAADKVVFEAPMWNFSFPPFLKAYIDTISIAGKTFKYTEHGPVGLLDDKPVVLFEARGGVYSEGPAKGLDHTESYLRTVMNFVGIESFKAIVAEGMAQAPEQAEEIYTEVEKQAVELAKTF